MRPALFLASLLFSLGAFVSACGDECSRAGDCPTGEVCRLGVCTEGQAAYLQCTSKADCGGDSSVLICLAGRCSFPASGLSPEAGVMSDVGTSTATDAGP